MWGQARNTSMPVTENGCREDCVTCKVWGAQVRNTAIAGYSNHTFVPMCHYLIMNKLCPVHKATVWGNPSDYRCCYFRQICRLQNSSLFLMPLSVTAWTSSVKMHEADFQIAYLQNLLPAKRSLPWSSKAKGSFPLQKFNIDLAKIFRVKLP